MTSLSLPSLSLSDVVVIHKEDLVLRHLLLFLIISGRKCHEHCVEDHPSKHKANKKWQSRWRNKCEKDAYQYCCSGNDSPCRMVHPLSHHPQYILGREVYQ